MKGLSKIVFRILLSGSLIVGNIGCQRSAGEAERELEKLKKENPSALEGKVYSPSLKLVDRTDKDYTNEKIYVVFSKDNPDLRGYGRKGSCGFAASDRKEAEKLFLEGLSQRYNFRMFNFELKDGTHLKVLDNLSRKIDFSIKARYRFYGSRKDCRDFWNSDVDKFDKEVEYNICQIANCNMRLNYTYLPEKHTLIIRERELDKHGRPITDAREPWRVDHPIAGAFFDAIDKAGEAVATGVCYSLLAAGCVEIVFVMPLIPGVATLALGGIGVPVHIPILMPSLVPYPCSG